MSIIPLVMRHYNLDSEEEFRVRYYVSRVGFDKIWHSKDRSTPEATEAFYNEHDADIWRQAYLSQSRYTYKKKILRAYHIAKKERAERVLDYGCGAGVLAHYLQQKKFTVDVADIPSSTLEFIRKRMNLHQALTIDSRLTLPHETYDFITCLDAIEHTFNPLEITKNLIGSLKKDGIFYIIFPKESYSEDRDHHDQHTQEAQMERPLTFNYLREVCDELVPETIYRKR